MALTLTVDAPGQLDKVNELIHDGYFEVADIRFDVDGSILSFRFRQVVVSGRLGWKSYFSSSRMVPAVEGVLKVRHVESYTVKGEANNTLDFDELVYDGKRGVLEVRTNIPSSIIVKVARLEVSVEVTDTILTTLPAP